jgi:hypothetical protein
VHSALFQDLNLPKDEFEGIEASAMQEMNQKCFLIRLIMDLMFGGKNYLIFWLKVVLY